MAENIDEITKPKRKKRGIPTNALSILLTILFSTIFLFAIGYLDYVVLSTLILPKDYCYFHLHDIPWWVELFYMSPGSNGHPDGSFFHLFILIILSVFLGYRTSRLIINKLIADNIRSNEI